MQTIVGVLRGGPSREHALSLRSGAAVLAALPEERFLARDIYIDKQGQWYDRGRATTPDRILHQIDVAIVGLHGAYGEDGGVQKTLELFGVPYTGSGPFASYLATHKLLSKMRAREAGVKTPEFRHIEGGRELESIVHEITRTFSQPVIVKPVGWGSSIGVSLVGGYAQILHAVQELLKEDAESILVEEYIRGREAAVGVIEGLRGEKLYTPPAHPGHFSRVESEELARLARLMHRELGLRHYSQSDFVVTPRGIYYLETDALPALAHPAILPQSLATVGVPFPDFLSHLVDLALAH